MQGKRRNTVFLGVLGVMFAAASTVHAQAIISNGTIALGVNAGGALNVACDPLTPGSSTTARCSLPGTQGVGLLNLSTGHDATVGGAMYEGWGVAVSGGTNNAGLEDGQDIGAGPTAPAGVTTFVSTANSATSTDDIASALLVTQSFHASTSADLYEIDVTLTNLTSTALGAGSSGILFRRTLDWNVEPSATTGDGVFSTIHGNGAANLIGTGDDYTSSNPLDGPSLSGCPDFSLATDSDFYHSGPCDHGATFDFGFAALAAGASRTFEIFYGAATNEATALADLGSVHADDVYSLGQSNCTAPGSFGDDPCVAQEETFVMGFKDVGGQTLGTPEPASVVLVATGFVGLGGVARRRRKRNGGK
jgi:type IV pilus assembly protein PilY1